MQAELLCLAVRVLLRQHCAEHLPQVVAAHPPTFLAQVITRMEVEHQARLMVMAVMVVVLHRAVTIVHQLAVVVGVLATAAITNTPMAVVVVEALEVLAALLIRMLAAAVGEPLVMVGLVKTIMRPLVALAAGLLVDSL